VTRISHLVITAGGQGLRLASVSGSLPKVLVPIGGKPLLQHQLELAAACGIRKVTILAGYLGNRVLEFVGDGSRFGLSVEVIIEAEPLGSAGSLFLIQDSLSEHFFFMNGDAMLAVDLQAMAKRHMDTQADLTMLVHPNDHPHDSDLIELDQDGRVSKIHRYPHPENAFFRNLVNAGLFVVRRDALRPLTQGPRKKDFTTAVVEGLVAAGARVFGYESSEYIKDMGTPARLNRVEADWHAGLISLDAARRPRPAVFLDRDGTLNVEKGHLRRPEDLELLPGVAEGLRELRQAGFLLAVLTNQPVVARGEATEKDVDAIHRRLEWELGKAGAYLDAIYYCPHHPDRGFAGERIDLKMQCGCRKPATGLFELARQELRIDTARSWMLGDHVIDVEMARRAGLRSILLRNANSETSRRGATIDARLITPDYVVDEFAAAVRMILKHAEQAPWVTSSAHEPTSIVRTRP
jgi:D,D-heptose 1,7-bisphosphate phosphatase